MKQLPDSTFEAARLGDVAARNEILIANLPLCRLLAHRAFRPPWPEVDDLVQVAIIGTMHAIRKYDPSRAAFSTYAAGWIKSSIAGHIFHTRRPVTIADRNRIKLLTRELDALPDEDPGRDAIRIKLAAHQAAASLDAPLNGDGETFVDYLRGEGDTLDAASASERQTAVQQAIETLPGRERYIIKRRLRGASLADIGREQGCSRERIRQIEARATKRLLNAVGGEE